VKVQAAADPSDVVKTASAGVGILGAVFGAGLAAGSLLFSVNSLKESLSEQKGVIAGQTSAIDQLRTEQLTAVAQLRTELLAAIAAAEERAVARETQAQQTVTALASQAISALANAANNAQPAAFQRRAAGQHQVRKGGRAGEAQQLACCLAGELLPPLHCGAVRAPCACTRACSSIEPLPCCPVLMQGGGTTSESDS